MSMTVSRKRGFSLIELMTVIAIMVILAGMIFGVAASARKKSRRVRADAEVRELAKAWKAYWMLYKEWPSGIGANTDKEMDEAAMTYLLGGNPQKVWFLRLDADDIHAEGGYKDPWGQLYRVRFDRTLTENFEYYETTVHFPNRNRSRYEYK